MFGPWSVSTVHSGLREGAMFGPWSVSTVHSEVSEREPCLVYGQCVQCTVRSQRGSHVWSMVSVYSAQ